MSTCRNYKLTECWLLKLFWVPSANLIGRQISELCKWKIVDGFICVGKSSKMKSIWWNSKKKKNTGKSLWNKVVNIFFSETWGILESNQILLNMLPRKTNEVACQSKYKFHTSLKNQLMKGLELLAI